MRSRAAASGYAVATLALVLSLSACGPRADSTPDTTSLTQSTAAGTVADIRVSEVQLGKVMGADMKITTPATTFTAKDTVHVAVSTTGSMQDASVLLMMKPETGDSVAVVQETKTISPTGPTVTAFHIAKPDVLKPGKYKVEVFLNGGLVDVKSIEITK